MHSAQKARRFRRWGYLYLEEPAKRDLRRAQEQFEGALRGAQAAGDHEREAFYVHALGDVSVELPDHDKAEAYFNQALAIARSIRSRSEESFYLAHLGDLELSRGNAVAAEGYFRQALDAAREGESIPREQTARRGIERATSLRAGLPTPPSPNEPN